MRTSTELNPKQAQTPTTNPASEGETRDAKQPQSSSPDPTESEKFLKADSQDAQNINGDVEKKVQLFTTHTLTDDSTVDDRYKTQYDPNGDPIINSGHDVARHLMSDRDDGDPALTLRGFILGSSLAVLSNMLMALFSAKPTAVGFGTMFEMLILLVSADSACQGAHSRPDGMLSI